MRKKLFSFARIVLLFLASVLASQAQNQSLAGAELTYLALGGNSYQLKLVVYRDCASSFAISNNQTVNYNSVNCNVSGSIPMKLESIGYVKACTGGLTECSGGNVKSFEKKQYIGKIQLNNLCTDFLFNWTGFNRSNKTSAFSSGTNALYVEALLNNLDAINNSSPTFDSEPLSFVFLDKSIVYNPNVAEIDGDLLTFSVEQPKTSAISNWSYNSGYSKDVPLVSTSPFAINSSNGDLVVHPRRNANSKPDTTFSVIKVTERRNNKIIGSVIRDMTIQVIDPVVPTPTLAGINGSNVFSITSSVCVGQVLTFNLIARSTSSNRLTLSLNEQLAGATLLTASTAKTVTGLFIWRPDSPGKKSISFLVRDNNCPVEGTDQKTFLIDVKDKPAIKLNFPAFVSIENCAEFTPTTIKSTVTGGNPGPGYDYTWFAVNDLTVLSSTTNEQTVSNLGKYYLTVKDAFKCTNRDSVEFSSTLLAFFKVNSDSVCEGLPVNFRNFSTSLKSGVFITSHSWNWGDGSPIVTSDNSVGNRDQVHTFATSGLYNVRLTVTNTEGCSYTYSTTIKVLDIPKPKFSVINSCQEPAKFVLLNETTTKDVTDLSKVTYRWLDRNNVVASRSINPEDIGSSETSGLYRLTLEAGNKACNAKITKNFKVYKRPRFTYITSSFTPKCNEFPLNTTTLGVRGAVASDSALAIYPRLKYRWSGSAQEDSLIVVPIPKTEVKYSVRITDTIGCFNDSSMVIIDSLVPNFRYSQFYCNPDDEIKVENQSVFRGVAPAYSEWNFDNAAKQITSVNGPNLLTTFQPNFSAASDTVMNVRLALEDIYGCKDTIVYSAVRLLPNTTTFGASLNTLCYKQPVLLSSARSRFINFWIWEYPNGQTDTLFNNRTFTQPLSPNQISRNYNDTTYIYVDRQFDVTKIFTISGNNLPVRQTIGYNETQKDSSLFFSDTRSKSIQGFSGCRYTQTLNLTLYPELKYQIDTSKYNQCAGFATTFEAKRISGLFSVVPQNFTWNFYKFRIDTTSNRLRFDKLSTTSNSVDTTSITATFFESGSRLYGRNQYVAVLNTKDTQGCVGQDSIPIDNISITGISIEHFSPISNCQNAPQSFFYKDDFGFSSSEAVHKWYFDDNTDTVRGGNSLLHTYKSSIKNQQKISLQVFGLNNPSTRYGKCTNTFYYDYTIANAPKAAIETVSPTVCLQDSVLLTPRISSFSATPLSLIKTYITNYDNGKVDSVTKSRFSYRFSSAGVKQFRLIAIDTSNCADTAYASFNVYKRPKANFVFESSDINDAPNVFANTPILFRDISDTDTSRLLTRTWIWGNNDTLRLANKLYDSLYNYPLSKIYFVKLTVANTPTCISDTTIKVDLTSFLAVPNAFSPNSDDRNDYFIPVMNGIKELRIFKVYNRWGQLIYDFSGRPSKGWDGTYNGAVQPMGSYIYYIQALSGRDEIIEKKGNVSLIK